MLIEEPSGNIFGMTMNAGQGWNPDELLRKQFLILSTAGGVRDSDGSPVALGYHTGHFELSVLVHEAAVELKRLRAIPFAGFCTDPCDGRSMGTTAMMDSLAYRNDAAQVFRRQARSLSTAKGVLGIASCDKGLPAMMMAIAGLRNVPAIIMPGGSMLAPHVGEDTGQVQSIGARFSQGEITLDYAQDVGCRSCASPGGGCQFFGTAGTSQAMSEALGLSLTHAALCPSGEPIWLDTARRSARALVAMEKSRLTVEDILSDAAFQNAMIVHAATGGSTNLLLHIPGIAHAVGRKRMVMDDWHRINQKVPRLVDVLPNGPVGHPTSRFFAAGGVPEVMLKLRELGLLDLSVMTVTGQTLGENLDWWAQSERRSLSRRHLQTVDGVDPDNVIMTPAKAQETGLTSTVTFPSGNLAPEGSVIKSTAIDPTVIDDDGVYRRTGPARVFRSESAGIRAIKSSGDDRIKAGDVMIVTCAGPQGSGMEELFQVTAALKYLSYGKQVTLLTDGRFSGVSTGACIGHIGPEALAGGPLGRVREGDRVRVIVDTVNLEGLIDLVGDVDAEHDVDWGTAELERRGDPGDLTPHPQLPEDTRLWAALQQASGGTWGGCVFDVDEIVATIEAGIAARAG
jgi:putative YjhG/YagF family dehydratase